MDLSQMVEQVINEAILELQWTFEIGKTHAPLLSKACEIFERKQEEWCREQGYDPDTKEGQILMKLKFEGDDE